MKKWTYNGLTYAYGYGTVTHLSRNSFPGHTFLLAKTNEIINCRWGNKKRRLQKHLWQVIAMELPFGENPWIYIYPLDYIECNNGWQRVLLQKNGLDYSIDETAPMLVDEVAKLWRIY